MGKLEQIDELEAYIHDLGNEIQKVKKASDYLKLIERQQSEIEKTVKTLNQSKQELKSYRDLLESKLELFLVTSHNIETKQQGLEQSLINLKNSINEVKEFLVNVRKENKSDFKEINNIVNQNKEEILAEVQRSKEEQLIIYNGLTKSNKLFFGINVILSMIILGVVIYSLM